MTRRMETLLSARDAIARAAVALRLAGEAVTDMVRLEEECGPSGRVASIATERRVPSSGPRNERRPA